MTRLHEPFNFARRGTRLAGVALALLMFGCHAEKEPITSQTSQYQVADEPSTVAGAPATRPSVDQVADVAETNPALGNTGARRPASQSVPNGDADAQLPAQLLATIRELRAKEPLGGTREEKMLSLQQTQEAIIETAEKLLEIDASDAMLMQAAQAKMSALNALTQLGVPDARSRMYDFCRLLKENSRPAMVELGRRVVFATRLDAFAAGVEQDPQPMLQEFNELIAHEAKDAELIALGRQVSGALEQTGHGAEARLILNSVASAFEGVADAEMMAAAAALGEEAEIVASDARAKFLAAAEGQPGADEEFLAAAQQLLDSPACGETTLLFLIEQAAFQFEFLQPQVAARLYEQIEAAMLNHQDAVLAAKVSTILEKYQRRASLIGRPFEVQGAKLDGEPLDWSEYRGKVVLVDFWATWCRPCLEEIPNIRANYEQYRDQGFEVVGVNLDDNPENVRNFFSFQRLPWPTVVSSDPAARGMNTPLAIECGIEFIPFIVLVGRDGNVAALNVRGVELGPKLAELLGQEAPTTADATGE